MLFAAVLTLGLATLPSTAQDDSKKGEAKLKVGDTAPAFNVSKWLQGKEVKSFEKGKIYVVEFWATWCTPCIRMMPHMSALQQEYKDKGVTFIAFTSKDDPKADQGNNQESVSKFVERRGPKLQYTFAYADNRDTYKAWMTDSGHSGIPCCFVIGKDSKIAFIGHPMVLDEVLPKVVAGTWTPDDVAAMEKTEKDVEALFEAFSDGPEAGLKAVAELEKKHPQLDSIPYLIEPKLSAMLKTKKTADAGKLAERLIPKATTSGDLTTLVTVSTLLRSSPAGGDKELLALSLKAAEAMLKVNGEKDPQALYFVAEAHFAKGDKAKAKEFGDKAIAAADDERMKAQLEKLTKKYSE